MLRVPADSTHRSFCSQGGRLRAAAAHSHEAEQTGGRWRGAAVPVVGRHQPAAAGEGGRRRCARLLLVWIGLATPARFVQPLSCAEAIKYVLDESSFRSRSGCSSKLPLQHSCNAVPVVSSAVVKLDSDAATEMNSLCTGHETAMKPVQLLQLAESIAAKQAAQAEASGKTPSQDCVLLRCALLQVSNANASR